MKSLYRVSQFCMSRVTRILEKKKHELVVGENSLYKIIDFLKDSGKTSVFISTTPGFIKRGTLADFFSRLEQAGIKTVIFTDVTPDPTIESVEKARNAYLEGGCQAIVAIGGGSVIDCSKAAAARIVRPKLTIRQMRGMLKINRQLPDFYAVPTTAGTGSEVTVASVVTDTVDGVHYKYAVSDPCLVPKCAVLDPLLTTSLPPAITAATGMDALTHAVEAYTNRFASPFVKRNALDAVKMIYENLPVVYEDGKNVKARENMLLASYYAGVAFTNNFVGYVHAVAHALGALY
nr:iron-containing alcohol dehydrogenase [Treponemataceae bacterium]